MRDDRRPRVRDRTFDDDAFIAELGRAAFTEYDMNAALTVLRMAARAPTLVLEVDGRRVGFVTIELGHTNVAHLSAIAVAEEARGKGLGRLLLRAAERLARSRSAVRMELTTADSNLAALQLFLSTGFRRAHAAPGEYSRGQRSLLLEKAL
jgi:ribosomal protein S18 acetylase RimI-like enzyme